MADGTLVLGLFDDSGAADRALSRLFESGVQRDDLSILAADENAASEFGIAKHSKMGEGAAIGAGVVGALGAAVAGFAAVGAIATGGAGLLIAGPIVAALAGAGAGAATGGVIGGLIGLGIPEHEVKVLSEKVKKGAVLLGVKCANQDADRIKSIFQDNGATRITTQGVDLNALSTRFAPTQTPAKATHATAHRVDGQKPVSGDEWGKSSPMHELFSDQLRDIYYAEHKLLDSLNDLEAKAHAPDLSQAIRSHRIETQGHIDRLNNVFDMIGIKPEQKTCPAINGIIAEAKSMLKMEGDPAQRDAAIICAAQKAEHYEIGTYGCLRTYARSLGMTGAADLLEQTLEEEWSADRKLSELAEGGINRRAMASL